MNNIEKILLNMGITPNIDGFNYLNRAIEICIESHSDKKQRPYYCAMYMQIGKEFNKSPSSVERAMRHGLNKARKAATKTFREMFVYDEDQFDSMKVTISFFVENIARHVIGGYHG